MQIIQKFKFIFATEKFINLILIKKSRGKWPVEALATFYANRKGATSIRQRKDKCTASLESIITIYLDSSDLSGESFFFNRLF